MNLLLEIITSSTDEGKKEEPQDWQNQAGTKAQYIWNWQSFVRHRQPEIYIKKLTHESYAEEFRLYVEPLIAENHKWTSNTGIDQFKWKDIWKQRGEDIKIPKTTKN